MHTIIFALLAVGAGLCIAPQASANGKFRQNIDEPLWAAFFSILGTVLTATIAMMILRPPAPSGLVLRSTAWWNWIGGPLGALIVLACAALTQTCAAPFIALVVGGQLLCSLLGPIITICQLQAQPITGRAFARPSWWLGWCASSTCDGYLGFFGRILLGPFPSPSRRAPPSRPCPFSNRRRRQSTVLPEG